MERFVKGDVVVANFYFFDANITKKRPACVLVDDNKEVILAEITTKSRGIDDILIKNSDFQQGKLREESWLRPLRLFTLHKTNVLYKLGHLKENKIKEIVGVICGFLREK